ncbi:MAG: glycerol-3-phosphate acyltransferase [Calditrichia bacterium]
MLGWKAGLVVLLIDMLRLDSSGLRIAIGNGQRVRLYAINYQIVAGISAMFGHIWTIFASFKGGKGVGTGAGMIIGLAPVPVLVCIIVSSLRSG